MQAWLQTLEFGSLENSLLLGFDIFGSESVSGLNKLQPLLKKMRKCPPGTCSANVLNANY